MPTPRSGIVAGLVALAVASFASATDRKAPPPMPVDETATPWACTAKTLDAATECFLEADGARAKDAGAQARENVLQAAALAARACATAARVRGEARPDGDLFPMCQKDFSQAAAEACSLDGEVVLLDAQGRFATKARSCYEALASVLRRTRMMATLAAPCCRCLAAKCSVEAAQCNRDFYEGEAGDASLQCLDKGTCRRECSLVAPPAAPVDAGGTRRAKTSPVEWL